MSLISRPDRTSSAAPIVVAGAGAVGLAAAIGLARAGLEVALVGRRGPERPGRTVALLDGTVAFLERIGVWANLSPMAAPLAAMRIVDATGSLFRPPPVVFEATELGLDAFGFNVPNAVLEAALFEAAEETPGLRVIPNLVTDVTFHPADVGVQMSGGAVLRASLVVAADGRRSQIRKAARIGVRETRHPQHALTVLLAHSLPHEGVSTEFHTRQGPFTLVPMPNGPDGSRRSSLVWVMHPSEAERRARLEPHALAAEVERQCGRLLGRVAVAGPVGRFPIVTSLATRLVSDRLVLIGEAAHALPPIGAQGLNLSFRDVAALVDSLGRGAERAEQTAALQAYARARSGDIAATAAGVGLLNGSLLSRNPGVDLLRGVGLAALSGSTRLRRLVMRNGLAPERRAGGSASA